MGLTFVARQRNLWNEILQEDLESNTSHIDSSSRCILRTPKFCWWGSILGIELVRSWKRN